MPAKVKVKIGQRFGSRRVLKTRMGATRSGKKRQFWYVQCQCGDKRWLRPFDVKKSSSCKTCKYKKDRLKIEIGTHFSGRKVINTEIRHGGQWLLLRCACGNEAWQQALYREKYRVRTCRDCKNKAERINVLGKRFGSRVVIKEERGRLQMRCDCGDVSWITATHQHLKQGQSCRKCCGKRQRLKVLIGQRFGSQTVLKTKTTIGHQRLFMRCDCGKTRWLSAHQVVTKKVKACLRCANKVSVFVGQKFGLRTVLAVKFVRKFKSHHHTQLVQMGCACGDIRWIAVGEISNGTVLRCKYCGTTMAVNKHHHPYLKEIELQKMLESKIRRDKQFQRLGLTKEQIRRIVKKGRQKPPRRRVHVKT